MGDASVETRLHTADVMRLSEPGDELLSLCVDAVEAGGVLSFVRGHTGARNVVDALAGLGVDITSVDLMKAKERW